MDDIPRRSTRQRKARIIQAELNFLTYELDDIDFYDEKLRLARIDSLLDELIDIHTEEEVPKWSVSL